LIRPHDIRNSNRNTKSCTRKCRNSGSIFDADKLRPQLAEIEKQAADPNLWSNPQKSQQVMREKKRLEHMLATDADLVRRGEDIAAYFDLAREGENVDADLRREIDALARCRQAGNRDAALRPERRAQRDRDDSSRRGRHRIAGLGRHAAAHVSTLGRAPGLSKRVLYDYQPGEEAGLKSATFAVNGEYAYGLLTSEIGVHRLVRISPFDQAKRRHTSFASVYVSPEIDDSIEIVIKPEDIRTDTYRSSGKGGQHVNTTDSAVRITHIPTGLCRQLPERALAAQEPRTRMSMLRSKLYEFEMEKKRAATKKIEDSKLDIEFGSQIRSYVLQPYRMIEGPPHQDRSGRRGSRAGRGFAAVHPRVPAGAARGESVMAKSLNHREHEGTRRNPPFRQARSSSARDSCARFSLQPRSTPVKLARLRRSPTSRT
jgi:peptide chain release factor 2